MHPPAWMTTGDITILRHLADTGDAYSPKQLLYNLKTREHADMSYRTINRRLSNLLDAEFIVKEEPDKGYYSITEKGRRFLAGDLPEEEIPDEIGGDDDG